MPVTRVAKLLMIPVMLFAALPPEAHALQVRRGGGLRVGVWDVDVAPTVTRSPHIELYLDRGLEEDLALENSIGVWRAVVNQTKAYILPLMTSLKYYPLTEFDDRVEPFVLGGLGFAFGLQDEDENAVGGANSTLVTGIGVRAGVGIELRLLGGFGLAAQGKYQWIHFGEEVGTMETFSGVGFEGAVTYRVPL
jgi:hypothetical protein